MQCVVLAGGRATRLRPLTDQVPKVLLPIAGRPFLDHLLEHFAHVGVDRVLLALGANGDQVERHVGHGRRWELEIECVHEYTEPRGTAGALRLAYDFGRLDPEFLVTYGDTFLPIDFAEVFAAFRRGAYPVMMTVYENHDRFDRSNVCLHPGDVDRVSRYAKGASDPARAGCTFIDYGLLAFRREVIACGIRAGERADLSDLFALWSARGELGAWVSPRRFYEIGSFAGLAEFRAAFLEVSACN